MRRMISQKLQDFIAKLFGHIDQTENTTEVGGDLEVDGNIKVNGVENLTDKDGNPLDFGGGSEIVDTEEIVHIEGEEGTELYLAQEVSNKVQNSLQLPLTHTEEKLVAVDTAGAQEMLGVGDGLEIDNGVLKTSLKISTLPNKFFVNAEDVDITNEELSWLQSNLIGVKETNGNYHCILSKITSNNHLYIRYGYYHPDSAQLYELLISLATMKMNVSVIEV